MKKNKTTNVLKYIKISLAFSYALHLSMSTAFCGHFTLGEIDRSDYKTRYNNLPSVEANDALLKNSPQFSGFLKDAEEIITRYELEAAVGLRLIHRHFVVDDNQVMAEGYAVINNIPSLVTHAQKFKEAEEKGAVPASWMFPGNAEDEVLLFEASNDRAVRRGNLQLQKSPEFFDEIGKALRENNFYHLLSLALLKRDSLVASENQMYMEVNADHEHKSVVQLWKENNAPQNTIRTSWSFKGPKQQRCMEIFSCCAGPIGPDGLHPFGKVGHSTTKDEK